MLVQVKTYKSSWGYLIFERREGHFSEPASPLPFPKTNLQFICGLQVQQAWPTEMPEGWTYSPRIQQQRCKNRQHSLKFAELVLLFQRTYQRWVVRGENKLAGYG